MRFLTPPVVLLALTTIAACNSTSTPQVPESPEIYEQALHRIFANCTIGEIKNFQYLGYPRITKSSGQPELFIEVQYELFLKPLPNLKAIKAQIEAKRVAYVELREQVRVLSSSTYVHQRTAIRKRYETQLAQLDPDAGNILFKRAFDTSEPPLPEDKLAIYRKLKQKQTEELAKIELPLEAEERARKEWEAAKGSYTEAFNKNCPVPEKFLRSTNPNDHDGGMPMPVYQNLKIEKFANGGILKVQPVTLRLVAVKGEWF